MNLHNFLVDYREAIYGTESDSNDDTQTERLIFEQDCSDNNNQPIVCGIDMGKPRGRPSIESKTYKRQGLSLRDTLRVSLMNHDMHRPKKEQWNENKNTHVARDT